MQACFVDNNVVIMATIATDAGLSAELGSFIGAVAGHPRDTSRQMIDAI